jgi:hypothetical protein
VDAVYHAPVAGSSGRKAPEHLNRMGCFIKYSEGKGRGVFGTLYASWVDYLF